MRVKFFTLLQLWIVIFWREIIELFLKIAQFRIDVIDKARVNICKFLNELFFSHILILTSSQNHIEIYRYLRAKIKSKNILEINLKMMEAQNDASYSSAFIRKKRKTDYWEFNENYIPAKRYLKMDFNFSTSESSCCSTISSELLVSNPAILTKFNAHPPSHSSECGAGYFVWP